MAFSTMQHVFIVEHYFRKQLYEAVEQAYQVHFSGAAVPNKSTIFPIC
jgi:ATP-dependent Clp protease adapter protein ClpS